MRDVDPVDYYRTKMDIPTTQDAIIVSCFPPQVEGWIWEKPKSKKDYFKVFE